MSQLSSSNDNGLNIHSVVLDKLLDDPQMKEVIVMEVNLKSLNKININFLLIQYERLTPWAMFKKLQFKSKKTRPCIDTKLAIALVICNLLLVLLFGLLAAAIMLAKTPPGKT